jgi:hypothetical protein
LHFQLDLAVTHDRAGNELREQRMIGGEFTVGAGARDFAPVDVDEVGDGLKGEERNADRQRDRGRRRQRMPAQCAGGSAGKLPQERAVCLLDVRCEDNSVSAERVKAMRTWPVASPTRKLFSTATISILGQFGFRGTRPLAAGSA